MNLEVYKERIFKKTRIPYGMRVNLFGARLLRHLMGDVIVGLLGDKD
jgi:hypothetical protein